MPARWRPPKELSAVYLPALALVLLAAMVVAAAEGSFRASLFGLRLWLEAVLPALMPFFALSEILAAYGVIHFLAVLLEPLMRPLFNIPGAGGFALAMGLVSGYPLGAVITARLCRDRLLNPVEGERLVSLANTADPLFMAGVVAAGFFRLPELGATLSVAHYLAVFLVGLMMARHDRQAPMTPPVGGASGSVWARALVAMARARREDGRPFGAVVGAAIQHAMSSMLLIGGTIILFSVLLEVLQLVGVAALAARAAGWLFQQLGLSPDLGPPLVRGLWEITNGTQASSSAQASLVHRAAMASFIIGWSGLSVHAQVAAVVQGTGIRLGPYVRARLWHGLLAALVTVALLQLGLGPTLASLAWVSPPQALGGAVVLWHARWAFGVSLALGLAAACAGLATALRRPAGRWW